MISISQQFTKSPKPDLEPSSDACVSSIYERINELIEKSPIFSGGVEVKSHVTAGISSAPKQIGIFETSIVSVRWDFSAAYCSSEESDSIEEGLPRLESYIGHQNQVEEDPLYENADGLPLYQNFPSSLFSCGSTVSEESEHIYDYISHSSLSYSPVNVFLSLIDGETTISPDPNIYEVPPGAILNSSYFPEEIPRNITPPIEFKDTLTWGRIHSFKEIYTNNSTEVIYSKVVKPKRIKYRPGLENIIKMKEQEENEIIVDGTEKDNTLVVLPECFQNEEKNGEIIISEDDGTTTSKGIKTDLETDQAKEDNIGQMNCECTLTDRSSKHACTDCMNATAKPIMHDENNENISTESKNIGAQIMQKYEEEMQKLKESKNLPDVSLLDVDESIENIEKERRRIIENQAVRAKRIDSWIKGFSECGEPDFCLVQDTNIDSMQNDEDLFDSAQATHYFVVGDLAELAPDGKQAITITNSLEEESYGRPAFLLSIEAHRLNENCPLRNTV
ncbi:hypothetical protein AAG570_013141 [Ranatra chinensis]|uniref:Uncharacterized protein n=1 Tax=Ranatra chinensis TaxID=642074 RepID=A0ABD0YFY9_9HEMI